MHRWLDWLFPVRADEEIVRALPLNALAQRTCAYPVFKTRPVATALLPYRDPEVRATIHEAKYRGSREAFSLLAAALFAHLAQVPATESVRLVPIPLGPARHKERGYNQAEEVAKRTGFPLETGLLERVRETESQVSLPRRKRAENMRGAFRAAHRADPTYLYIVFDDVTTTGATLQAAIDALTEAGAEHILPLALAH